MRISDERLHMFPRSDSQRVTKRYYAAIAPRSVDFAAPDYGKLRQWLRDRRAWFERQATIYRDDYPAVFGSRKGAAVRGKSYREGPVERHCRIELVVEADTAAELDGLVTSLPVWPHMISTITPLSTCEDRADALRAALDAGRFPTSSNRQAP
jgi:hypothetical protein